MLHDGSAGASGGVGQERRGGGEIEAGGSPIGCLCCCLSWP
jgi:hypothetical protein